MGGRWSHEALSFVRSMAEAKARSFPRIPRASAQIAYTQRWTGMISVAAHRAFARTLLKLPADEVGADVYAPELEDVLHEAMCGILIDQVFFCCA